MARHITELRIPAFRGVKDLSLTDLGDVNIIVGDNNCGKTSVLEAIQLVSDPVEYNIFQVAGLRLKHSNPKKDFDNYEIIKNLLSTVNDGAGKEKYLLDISATAENKTNFLRISGKNYYILENGNEILSLSLSLSSSSLTNGNLLITPDRVMVTIPFDVDSSNGNVTVHDTISIIKPANYNPDVVIGAVYSIDHVINNDYKHIFNNIPQTTKAISLLKRYNENIVAMRYLNKNGEPVPVIDSDSREGTPVHEYGDGMKKVLAIIEAILKSEDGILLVDEFEDAIHPSAMNDSFSFILKACKEMKIQLFLTTHSIEAIDSLLGCTEAEPDNIRVITLKKRNGKTYSQTIDGGEAEMLRMNNNAELR